MRLIKSKVIQSNIDESTVKNSLLQVSDKGRNILKELQDLKFTLNQTITVLNNLPQISNGLKSKEKTIDSISQELYQLIFDIENINISESFMEPKPIINQDVPNESNKNKSEKDNNNNTLIPNNNQSFGPPNNSNISIPENPNIKK